MAPPGLSIVIPAFNEKRRILPALEKIRHFLNAEKMDAEILVVNDGSTDDTAALVGLPYKDTQCGFKLFTREAVEVIFPLQTIDGFGFDVEILYIARKLGLRAVEVPVVWNHSEDTRVNLTSGTRAFLDILRVRYLDLHGAYKDRVASRRGLR